MLQPLEPTIIESMLNLESEEQDEDEDENGQETSLDAEYDILFANKV